MQCRRVRHLPQMRILHHAGKAGYNPKIYAQLGYARRLFATKHFSPPRRVAFQAAQAGYFGSRALAYRFLRRSDANAALAMRLAVRSVIAPAGAPFEPEPPMAVRPRRGADRTGIANRTGPAR